MLVPVAAAVVVALVVAGVVYLTTRSDDNGGNGSGDAPAAIVYGSPPCDKSIGFMGALTGSVSSIVTPMRDAAKLAVEQYNGQHAGCTVKFVEFDTEADPAKAASAVAGFQDDLLGLVGPAFSNEVKAAGPALDSIGLAFITPSAGNDELGEQGWAAFHRAYPTQAEEAAAAAKYLAETLKQTKVYVVAETDDYSKRQKESFGKDKAVQVAASADIDANTDVGELATTIAHSGAEAVFYAGFSQLAVSLLKPLREAGFQGGIVSGDGVYDGAFPGDANDTSGSTFVLCGCRSVTVIGGQAASDFAQAFAGAYDTSPSDLAGIAFDSANMLLKGVSNGADSRDRMVETLAGLRYEGVMGPYQFTHKGELVDSAVRFGVYRVADGKLTYDSSMP